MSTQITPNIDLVALMENIHTQVRRPKFALDDPGNARLGSARLAQVANRLHAFGYADVELVAVLCTATPTYDEQSGAFSFESSAFALRQGQTLVGHCGARDITGLTTTAHDDLKSQMRDHHLPVSTHVVVGDDAMRLAPLLNRTRQAHINAVVDKMCLSQAVDQSVSERPALRM